MLRSNVADWSPEELWRAYIQLTEAEEAFRIQKSDLRIRPVWHHKQERVEAHILVCFLTYVLWRRLGQMCQAAGLGDEPRKVFAELSELAVVDVDFVAAPWAGAACFPRIISLVVTTFAPRCCKKGDLVLKLRKLGEL